MELIDSHVHLDHKDFDDDQNEVIARARKAGVKRFISIGASDGFDSAERVIKLSEANDFIFATAGIHPHDAAVEYDVERLTKLCEHPRVVAVGETGLDFFRDWSPHDRQYEWFKLQVGIAREVKKPLVIHSRDAGAECLQVLLKENAAEVGGVMHCYSEDFEFAKRLFDINFYISFPGTVTFKKADSVREVVKSTPLERILVETDAPYMAPVPFRGKRCESAFMVETARMIADIKEMSLESCAKVLVKNTEKLFRL